MKISEDFIKSKIDNKCVLVPIGEGYRNGIFELNETAERIFDLLSEGKDRDEIVEALCTKYDSERSEITACVDEYIKQLRGAGILEDD